ncbi:hypothetical protein [Solidesulfovibrio aerotolerans]|nr:hypothetical protein [Solidesulfovibrio aerotolerans]
MKTQLSALRRAAATTALAAFLAATDAQADGSAASVESGDLLINLILLGLAMFVLFRFLSNRSKNKNSSQPGQPPRYIDPDNDSPPLDPTPPGKPNMYTNAQASWDRLKSPETSQTAPPTAAPQGQPQSQSQPQPPAPSAPDDEFLAGAKIAYSRIAASLGTRDFNDLGHFVSPSLLTQLKNTLPATPAGKPDILLVEATLASHTDDANRTTMVVDYKALRREPGASQNAERTERWTFARDNATPGANWLLEKME